MDSLSLYAEISHLVKAKRKLKNLSQEELAWQAELNLNSLGKIERVEGEYYVSTLFKVLKKLDVTPEEIKVLINQID